MQSTTDDELADMMRALGHPVRLQIMRILVTLKHGDCCCTDVTQCLSLAQSTVSQHIKVLMDAGLVERQPRGTRNCYVLRPERLALLQNACGTLFADLSDPRQSAGLEPA